MRRGSRRCPSSYCPSQKHLHFQGDLVLVNDSAARLHKLAREKSDALVDEFVARDEEGPMRSTRSRAAKKCKMQ